MKEENLFSQLVIRSLTFNLNTFKQGHVLIYSFCELWGIFNIQFNISLFGPCPTSTALERLDEYWNCIAQPGKLDSKPV